MKKLILFFFCAIAAFPSDISHSIDFENDAVNTFPEGWTSKDKTNMVKVYKINKEDNNKFLHATADKISVTIGFDKEWHLSDYPKLKWRWRPIEMPIGTNEKIKSGNDDVLGVYVLFGGFPIPKTIKYIWSETLPIGTILESPYSAKTKMIVIKTGEDGLNEWHGESRNVLEDYRSLFGESGAKPTAKGIAVLTDSDNTATHVTGDYDDFVITK
ncbi:DUF3047 domain-containing protein [bacterium]|nr:DUF3047 domain-containing protein [bacterium]